MSSRLLRPFVSPLTFVREKVSRFPPLKCHWNAAIVCSNSFELSRNLQWRWQNKSLGCIALIPLRTIALNVERDRRFPLNDGFVHLWQIGSLPLVHIERSVYFWDSENPWIDQADPRDKFKMADVQAAPSEEPAVASESNLMTSQQVLTTNYASRQSSVLSEGFGTGTDVDGSQDGGETVDDNQTTHVSEDLVSGVAFDRTSSGESPQALLEKHEESFQAQRDRQKRELIALLTDRARAPEASYKNSKKEELALAYSDNFNRQYTHLYPGRKELLLSPPNSFGIKACEYGNLW